MQVTQFLVGWARNTFAIAWGWYYGLEWQPMKLLSAIFFFFSLVMYSNMYLRMYVTVKDS